MAAGAKKAVAMADNPGNPDDPAQMLAALLKAQAEAAEALRDTLDNSESWNAMLASWRDKFPAGTIERQQALWSDLAGQWQTALAEAAGSTDGAGISDSPLLGAIDQTYRRLAEEAETLAAEAQGIDLAREGQLRFFTRALIEAMNPANFALTNPQVFEKAQATGGESLVKGMEHLLADLARGQLTHSDPSTFRLGETIAATPGKVVHKTPLYELILYSPSTEKVLETPLVIFPPWINRFYILDLSPAKSFVRWAVDQGITVFMVSWKSADESMAEVILDDYIKAQIDAIDTVAKRLKVPSVHTVGYCVAGTTLAATLAILARRGEASKVASATFLTAQVDFAEPGDLKHFVDDGQLALIGELAPKGYLDGRIMAATFNLLRGRDLIWRPAVKHYLLGEDRPAFDLLHWNGDVTNLPAKWHTAYLRDLYQHNRLVQPDALSALDTPIDLRRITTPCYIQAGREDHIAPPHSVWQLTQHVAGPWTFVLAGSGHIAGVVNPPASGKYQYWTNPAARDGLDTFIGGAEEHKGSWWPHWAVWLRAIDPRVVAAKGKRKPGGRKGAIVLEDAPGSYVRMR